MRKKLFSYCIIISFAILSSCNEGLVGDCEKIQEWSVQNYRIVKSRCPGLVLAHYVIYDVYSDGKLSGDRASQIDSCIFTWQANNESYITFDVCNNSIQELKPQKNLLDKYLIDSVSIITNKSGERRLLSSNQTENFVKDWNISRASDYSNEPFDSSFSVYPPYQYKLTVFYKGSKRHFYGYNYLILDSSNWAYEMSKSDDLDYFHKYWKK